MSIETIKPGVVDHEPKEVVSYNEYRIVCDDAQPNVYRKTGIASEEGYQEAIADQQTVYVELGGRRLPLFTPLENVDGYDVERTKQLSGVDNVFVLALPPEFIDLSGVDLDAYLGELGENAAVVIESATAETQQIKDSFSNKLDGGQWKVHDYLDTRCPEGEQVARISMYAAHFEAQDENGSLLPRRGLTLKELYNEDVEVTGDDNTVLIEASDLRNSEELLQKLWELHDEKFDWLGEFHPVSMQESEEFFKTLVTDDRTMSVVRYDFDEDGIRVPVCHGIFMEAMDQVSWVNDRYVNEAEQEAENNDEEILFFYGVASKSTTDKMLHYSRDVMGLTSRLMKRRGGKTELLFESTTMSSQYIPSLVEKYTRGEPNGMTMTEAVRSVSQVDYWSLVSEGSEIV